MDDNDDDVAVVMVVMVIVIVVVVRQSQRLSRAVVDVCQRGLRNRRSRV